MKNKATAPIELLLPKGWQEAARTEHALTRKGRQIKTAEDLLRLNFLYLTEGESFGQTAAILQLTEKMPLSKNAVYERIINSGPWLKWMCEHLCREKGIIQSTPDFLKPYRVCLVDASAEAKRGSTKIDYRLHYMIELFNLSMVEMHMTTSDGGETITRYNNFKKDDLIIGDRAYGTLKGISYVAEKQAHYLFRLKANSFQLYQDKECKVRFDLTETLKDWAPHKEIDLDLYCKSGKDILPIRVCAIGKTQQAIEQGTKRIKVSNHGKQRGKVSELQSIYNHYIVVVTSLPKEISTKDVLELYHMRWQIELVFKRMKSIFDFDKMPSQNEKSAYSWFYGKLLIALICELLVQQGHFSPSDEI